ncbi:hypothetical protein A9Z42_0041750 [Trichoderma parareesei]|uniref:Uncharacterized protein n=1 Tax=Trichoderma parareesei TaxID=858221 RepID=A0A2H2ZFZ3_TRIPA|nr:hypothetical protein A9Z42_0041750 [Trichoderma parareesei]
MPSNDRLRRHKRRNASGRAKTSTERQLAPVDHMEESQILEISPTQLTEIDLKPQATMKQACDAGSTQTPRDAPTSGDHRNAERLASPETKRRNKDAPKPKDNEIKKGVSQGYLMAEDGPWNTVSLSSDEDSGWVRIHRDDYEAEWHAVSHNGHDVSQKDAGACNEDDYVNLVEEDWELVDEWTSVDV